MHAWFRSVTKVDMTGISTCGQMVSHTPWWLDCINHIWSCFWQCLFSRQKVSQNRWQRGMVSNTKSVGTSTTLWIASQSALKTVLHCRIFWYCSPAYLWDATIAQSQSFCKGKFFLAACVDQLITQFAANELLFCKALRQKHRWFHLA